MQENLNTNTEPVIPEPACVQCGNPDYLEGHATRLCSSCRQSFIKYPIPLWVKLFGASVVVFMVVSLVLSPKNFTAAIALSRAEHFEKAHMYVSEQKELNNALAIVPESKQAQAHMAIASFYNADMVTYGDIMNKLVGKEFEDAELLRELNNLSAYAKDYYPSDKLTKLGESYKTGIPDTTYQHYIKQYPEDVFAQYAYASTVFDKENYGKSDTLLAEILKINPHYVYALFMQSIAKRELGQLEASAACCDKLLQENPQLVMALSSKARTLLKQGRLKDALSMAVKAKQLDSNFYYNEATLALAYHLNKQTHERDAIVKHAQQDSTLAGYMQYANEVISGKRKF
jgi:predicted Zn-dependent protease